VLYAADRHLSNAKVLLLFPTQAFSSGILVAISVLWSHCLHPDLNLKSNIAASQLDVASELGQKGMVHLSQQLSLYSLQRVRLGSALDHCNIFVSVRLFINRHNRQSSLVVHQNLA
jgi:hypothetical protein